ncbi:RecQ family ATP-dependent DNA helicase [Granulicella sp. 5B5]|uniref:RecQ family ATP-dependent DNA helicase n=1 Tax=Granulicella sp. 5B5 TaxID=1617967 RepID=UPI0015F77CCF|nr:RecQ family ATP-dependent DNA helicase [Granulicella sp. 5B5]QMV17490.1 RecQ family ATP-dependent DNA helicase [Granulicella sp. 5B5]
MPTSLPTENRTHESLAELLHRVFGHREFRAHQREVCEAATAGRDVLLVMPTGAGKSLCYQLPTLARGGAGSRGTGLVISPLIALMDDQATKLSALGCRVARVHSGLSREAARQACRDYLAGELDFLFIAPERMRVPGFPEMLAKRKPALVAIDEAHCISAWGHDFRPDYRTLGQYLPMLRPAPIVALTATATPTVQKDIAAQLELQEPAVFITGFRRNNLAVEAVELSKPQRAEFAAKLLMDASARPAIVYAASRKDAEEIAGRLGKHFPAAAYHAGLMPEVRERVQTAFLSGKLDVVVATVAFGMGVDKADVRTVVHVALPGSVEAYYQEIGRAGRDGEMSRTVLLYSYADRRTQEFFLEKNYPAVSDLERVAMVLGEEPVDIETLQRALGKKGVAMERETLERAVEKLHGVGVAEVDFAGVVRAGDGRRGLATWKSGYDAQVSARRSQIDSMMAYAEGHQCRMVALVRHFGDASDRQGPCGHCDVCKPGGAGQEGHAPDESERRELRRILKGLEGRGQSLGKLFTELQITSDRKRFDALIDGLARAGLVSIANDTFTNPEGKEITYRKATITFEGREPDDATLATVWIRGDAARGLSVTKSSKKTAKKSVVERALTKEDEELEARLRKWRSDLAKKNGAPAFTVFADSTMRTIVLERPRSMEELFRLKGLGPAKVEKFGAEILAICRGEEASATVRETITKASPREAVQRSFPSTEAVRPKEKEAPIAVELNDAQLALEEKLKAWRKEEAAKTGLPSFFVLSDTVLRAIAAAAPETIEGLKSVRGVGPEKVDKFGAAVVGICRGRRSAGIVRGWA